MVFAYLQKRYDSALLITVPKTGPEQPLAIAWYVGDTIRLVYEIERMKIELMIRPTPEEEAALEEPEEAPEELQGEFLSEEQIQEMEDKMG